MVWAYDVCRSILLAEMVVVAQTRTPGQPNLSAEKLHELRVLAIVGDFAWIIDDDWSAEERTILAGLVKAAVDRLRDRPEITNAEGRAWKILDEKTITWRGRPEPTAAVIEFGEMVADLLDGSHLPDPGSDRRWFYGFPGGRRAL